MYEEQQPIRTRKPHKANFMRRYQLYFILALLAACALFLIITFLYYVPARASLLYGPPARSLSISDRIDYSTRLLSHGDALTTPLDPNGLEQSFFIEQGESVLSITARLEESYFISNADYLYDYLVYTGMDTTLQAGEYSLSPSQSVIEIANELQDATPTDITFVILPGWRMEEIAASLPTSGLDISPEAFLSAGQTPPQVLAFASPSTMEGFFLPDSYLIPRTTNVNQLLDVIARNFTQHISDEMLAGFFAQGLSIDQAVILASIVERESIHNEEMTMIASVFINRLNIGMTLGSDPTIQYALGYDALNQTWWTNPLSLDDLKFDSPYNTYLYAGLPPTPISNPSLDALNAVAFPDSSPYYYFQATCDGSGYHTFAVTFDEHLANGCP